MMKLIALVVAIALSALTLNCGDGPVDCEGSFSVLGDFTPEERQDIDTAAARFGAWYGRSVTLDRPGSECQIKSGRLGPKVVGEAFSHTAMIVLDRDAMPEVWANRAQRQVVIMHELGHAHGLHHLALTEPGVMSAGVAELTLDFVAADLIECRSVGGCR